MKILRSLWPQRFRLKLLFSFAWSATFFVAVSDKACWIWRRFLRSKRTQVRILPNIAYSSLIKSLEYSGRYYSINKWSAYSNMSIQHKITFKSIKSFGLINKENITSLEIKSGGNPVFYIYIIFHFILTVIWKRI